MTDFKTFEAGYRACVEDSPHTFTEEDLNKMILTAWKRYCGETT